MTLASRAQIVSAPVLYQTFLSVGLSDQDIRDGSLGMGRVYCY